MRKSLHIIAGLVAIGLSHLAIAGNIPLQDNPPDRYVVVKGDTLWDISKRFLKEPWRWPEIWRMNKEQIRNPHLIYPGDVIVLDLTGGDPQLRLLSSARRETVKLTPQVRASDTLAGSVPAINPTAINAFLGKPLIIEPEGLKNAPYILENEDNRVIVGAGNVIYVHGIKDKDAVDWQIYRPGREMKDPDTGAVLGHEAIYLGDAKVRRFEGYFSVDDKRVDAATLEVTRSLLEINKGDRLIPMSRDLLNIAVPHAPDKKVVGRIIAAYNAVDEVGQNSIIAINKGRRDGIENGHVFALMRFGGTRLSEKKDDDTDQQALRLPDERYGLIYVFRTFENVSYALVTQVTRPVKINDWIQTP